MKRSPLKRSKPLSRGDQPTLKGSPEKARAFLQRGRQPLQRSELRAAPQRRRAADDPTAEDMRSFRIEVWRLAEGRCTVSGTLARDPEDRRFHAHHVVPQQTLRAHGLHRYRADPRGAVWLRADVHDLHEHSPRVERRVPWTALPARVWDYARELDELEGTSWATELICRRHPAPGDRAHRPGGPLDGED